MNNNITKTGNSTSESEVFLGDIPLPKSVSNRKGSFNQSEIVSIKNHIPFSNNESESGNYASHQSTTQESISIKGTSSDSPNRKKISEGFLESEWLIRENSKKNEMTKIETHKPNPDWLDYENQDGYDGHRDIKNILRTQGREEPEPDYSKGAHELARKIENCNIS